MVSVNTGINQEDSSYGGNLDKFVRVAVSLTLWRNAMKHKGAEHHTKAAEHHAHAAHHHREAAKHHEAGTSEKGAHDAHAAHGHTLHARHHADEAAKYHADEHGH